MAAEEDDKLTFLDEKDFIQEDYRKNPIPFWVLLVLFVATVAAVWGGKMLLANYRSDAIDAGPFLKVTNRDFSLFLWQNSQFMRVNVSNKTGYLPGFQYNQKVTVEPEAADQFVSAPPELLFLYHTWKRLLSTEFIPRRITPDEFQIFLDYAEEWQPEYWPAAPQAYVDLVKNLSSNQEKDLATLPPTTLPLEVQQAFVGWKNYLLETSEIDALKPSYQEVRDFLREHSHYARNYWRNILMDDLPFYLKSIDEPVTVPTAQIPQNEMSGFLRVAIFNYLKSKSESSQASSPSQTPPVPSGS